MYLRWSNLPIGRESSESRMRENRTYGLMRGGWKPVSGNKASASYSTIKKKCEAIQASPISQPPSLIFHEVDILLHQKEEKEFIEFLEFLEKDLKLKVNREKTKTDWYRDEWRYSFRKIRKGGNIAS